MKAFPIKQHHLTVSYWRYEQYARKAIRPVFSPEQLAAEGYFGQCGQDKWIVERLLHGQRGGVFVDVGAHDGSCFSNTLYLEQELEWTGLAVEPIPDVFQRLKSNRRCAVVQGCVAARSGRVRFQVISGYSEMLSGISREYDPQHEDRITRELAQYGGSQHEIEVDAFTLTELLESHAMPSVDYLSIDVEGAELAVLNSLDWNRFPISIISVENAYRDWRIPRLLGERGYRFDSIVGDEFYVHERFHLAS